MKEKKGKEEELWLHLAGKIFIERSWSKGGLRRGGVRLGRVTWTLPVKGRGEQNLNTESFLFRALRGQNRKEFLFLVFFLIEEVMVFCLHN